MNIIAWVKGFNKADKTLSLAAALFVVALILRMTFRESIVAEGFLFATEAALVGGVADWFAVTALFEKPLGFPYHTAILPRRRAEFIAAATQLIEREFFSRRKMFSLMKSYDLRTPFVAWLKSDNTRDMIKAELFSMVRRYVEQADFTAPTREWSAELRHTLLSVPLSVVMIRLRAWLMSGRDHEIIAAASSFIRARVDTDETREAIRGFLQDAYDKKMESMGIFASLGAMFAQALDAVNLDDIAKAIQDEVLAVLDEAATEGSMLETRMLDAFYARFVELSADEELEERFAKLRGDLLRKMPIDETISSALDDIKVSLVGENAADDNRLPLRDVLGAIIDGVVTRSMAMLDDDAELKKSIDALIDDVAMRSALEAREMSGVVTREVMTRLTDKELNKIVYEKVEPDLLWIRMNGSIVGAIIGVALFVIINIVKFVA